MIGIEQPEGKASFDSWMTRTSFRMHRILFSFCSAIGKDRLLLLDNLSFNKLLTCASLRCYLDARLLSETEHH